MSDREITISFPPKTHNHQPSHSHQYLLRRKFLVLHSPTVHEPTRPRPEDQKLQTRHPIVCSNKAIKKECNLLLKLPISISAATKVYNRVGEYRVADTAKLNHHQLRVGPVLSVGMKVDAMQCARKAHGCEQGEAAVLVSRGELGLWDRIAGLHIRCQE